MSTVKSKNLQVGTDATATNNFTIYQPSTPDGTLRIGVGNADNPTEVAKVTNAGIINTSFPHFFGKLASNQTLTRATVTKITGFTSDEIDSASAFDGTTFTVPSGQGGIYFIFSLMTGSFDTVGNDGENIISYIYKNGSAQALSRLSHVSTGRDISYASVQHSFMMSLNAGDTVEMYGYLVDANGSGNAYVGTASTYFGGYRIG